MSNLFTRNLKQTSAIWWAMCWRIWLYFIVHGLLLDEFIALLKPTYDQRQIIGNVSQALCLAVTFLIVVYILNKQHNKFIIRFEERVI